MIRKNEGDVKSPAFRRHTTESSFVWFRRAVEAIRADYVSEVNVKISNPFAIVFPISRTYSHPRRISVLAPVFSESDFPPALSRDPRYIVIDFEGYEMEINRNEHQYSYSA